MSEGLAAGSVGCEFECLIPSIRGGYPALIWRVVTLLSESSDGREPGSQPPETGSSVIRPLLMSQTIADPLTAQSPHPDLFTDQSDCIRMSLSLLIIILLMMARDLLQPGRCHVTRQGRV